MELRHKYEIYIPNCYKSCGSIVHFSEKEYGLHLNFILRKILNTGVTGCSIREEVGYYNTDDNVSVMTNNIIYFYSNSTFDIKTEVCNYIKQEMYQETVLVVSDSVAELV